MLAVLLSLLAASPNVPWRWCEVGFDAQGFDELDSFWVMGPNDVWVMTRTKAAHFDGTRWQIVDGQWIGAAHVGGSTWLVSGVPPFGLYRFNGKKPEAVELTEGLSFERVQTVSPAEAWATGSDVAHFQDGGWAIEANAPPEPPHGPPVGDLGGLGREVRVVIPQLPLHVFPKTGDRPRQPGPEWLTLDGGTWVSKPLELPAYFGWNRLWSVAPGEGHTVYGLLPINEDNSQVLVQWRAGRIISQQRLEASFLGAALRQGSVELWAAGRGGSVLRRQKTACPR